MIADSPFLLRFLRTRKFSVPQACSLLERYLATRQIYSRWFQNVDYDYPAIMEIIDSGYLLPLPCRDSKNRQVLMANPSESLLIHRSFCLELLTHQDDFRPFRHQQVLTRRHGQDARLDLRVSLRRRAEPDLRIFLHQRPRGTEHVPHQLVVHQRFEDHDQLSAGRSRIG